MNVHILNTPYIIMAITKQVQEEKQCDEWQHA